MRKGDAGVFYVTKYALSQGIMMRNGEVDPYKTSPSLLVCDKEGKDFDQPMFHGEGKDWHRTKESAVEMAAVNLAWEEARRALGL